MDEEEMKKVPRRDRTALPKLQMNPGSSATEMIQVLQQWMSQMGLVLATWTDTATEWWQRVISEARADHVQFCRLGARERALLHGQSRETFALPTAVSPLEGTSASRSDKRGSSTKGSKERLCICNALILSRGFSRSSSGSICLVRARADLKPFRLWNVHSKQAVTTRSV